MALREPTSTGYIPYKGYKTWYQIFGTLSSPNRPLLVIHGGPGAGHNYMLTLQDLAFTHDIPVIMYDQIGCGNSSAIFNKDLADPETFWTMDLYLDEMEAVVKYLGVKEWDVIGNSFGGCLVVEHALRRPAGLKHVVIGCSLAWSKAWGIATQIWRDQLPDNGGAIMRKHELEGTMGSAEYVHWTEVFNERHECRVIPMPKEVKRTFEMLDENPDAGVVMLGPTNVDHTGTIADWDIRPQLPNITYPTLTYWGKYDVGQDLCNKPFADLIPGAKAYKFLQGSHMPHWEQRELHMKLVGDYLLDKELPETQEGVLEKLK